MNDPLHDHAADGDELSLWLHERICGASDPHEAAVRFIRRWYRTWEQIIPPKECGGRENFGFVSLRSMAHAVSDALDGRDTHAIVHDGWTGDFPMTSYLLARYGPYFYHAALDDVDAPIPPLYDTPGWLFENDSDPLTP